MPRKSAKSIGTSTHSLTSSSPMTVSTSSNPSSKRTIKKLDSTSSSKARDTVWSPIPLAHRELERPSLRKRRANTSGALCISLVVVTWGLRLRVLIVPLRGSLMSPLSGKPSRVPRAEVFARFGKKCHGHCIVR